MKRVLIAADTHCGHRSGLTPPEWWLPLSGAWAEVARMQRELWRWFERTVKAVGPFDAAAWVGDLIDGRGERSGSTELVEVDRNGQCLMAAGCIKAVPMRDSGKIIICKGTPYHTGNEEDFEEIIAREVDATAIGGHEWLEVNGCVFDLKHKIGSSQVPHGRHTAVARDRLWNLLWADKGYAPRADVICRAHVHYHAFAGGSDWLGMTLPALQGPGSKYGVRQCSGIVDFGFVTFEIDEQGAYTWKAHLLDIKAGRPRPVKC